MSRKRKKSDRTPFADLLLRHPEKPQNSYEPGGLVNSPWFKHFQKGPPSKIPSENPVPLQNRRKTKGQHDQGQQDRESPREKSSSERVSERTSENLREVHWYNEDEATKGDLSEGFLEALRDSLGGGFSSRRLSVLLPLIVLPLIFLQQKPLCQEPFYQRAGNAELDPTWLDYSLFANSYLVPTENLLFFIIN